MIFYFNSYEVLLNLLHKKRGVKAPYIISINDFKTANC